MSSHEIANNEQMPRLRLVDPITYEEILNSATETVSEMELHTAEIRHVIDEMLRIAAGKDEEGGAQMVGLAAPQLGVGKRIAIVDVNAGGTERQEQSMVTLINPRITAHSETLVDGREGCWSCDDFCANVPRYEWVEIEALEVRACVEPDGPVRATTGNAAPLLKVELHRRLGKHGERSVPGEPEAKLVVG